MALNLKYLKIFTTHHLFWIRIFGCGISGKNISSNPLLFSERDGLTKTLNVGKWSFKLLRKE